MLLRLLLLERSEMINSLESASYLDCPFRSKIRLAIFIFTPELWPSVETVWATASRDDRFITSVVLLNSADPHMSLVSQVRARRFFEASGIPYFTEQSFSLECYQPHVAMYTSPYSSLHTQTYKPEVVAATGCRIVYVPYGLEVGGGLFNARYQYDGDVQRVAWRIFARSPTQLANFGRFSIRGNGHVVVTGHPRSEQGRPRDIPAHRSAIAKSKGRSIILWTPHFTVSTRRKWSSFLDYYETIPRLIDERPDLFLLIRPHPFLGAALAQLEGWGTERVAFWFKALNERDNAHVDIESDYRPAFDASSALMADAGSFLVEYLGCGKPICHLSGEGDIGLNEEVRSLGCFYPGTIESDMISFLDGIRDSCDPLSEARQEAHRSYFGSEAQTPSRLILNEIARCVSEPPSLNNTTKVSNDHENAFDYWMNVTSTFIHPENYYELQEIKIREILGRQAKGRFAADIGCGNGRFTELISEHFEFTAAVDPNAKLIEEAQANANRKGISNIAYTIERLEHIESLSSYHFLSCLGVTSGLIDDAVFLKSIWLLKAALLPGAKLLVNDTLSLSTPKLIRFNGYTAVYRNITAYLGAFEAAGLSLVEEQVILQDDEMDCTNRFFVFELA